MTIPAVGVPDPAAASYDADLAWLDRLLEREVLRLRVRYELSLDELRGLYISDRQVDELVRRRDAGAADGTGPIARLSAEAAEIRSHRAPDTPLAALVHRLRLSRFEADLLLLAAAPQLSLKYETLYAYLNDDITRKHATVDLALRVLEGTGPVDRAALRPDARLFSLGLLDWIGGGADQRSLLSQGFSLAPPAAAFLLGLPPGDPRLPRAVRVLPPANPEAGQELLSGSARAAVESLAARHPLHSGLVVCTGDAPSEEFAAARAWAARAGRPIVTLPLSVLSADPPSWPVLRSRVSLLAMLAQAAIVVFDELDAFPREPEALLHLARVLRDLAVSGAPVIWAVSSENAWAAVLGDQPIIELELPRATCEERASTWRRALSRLGVPADGRTIDELADRFLLPCSRILVAAQTASRARTGAGEDATRDALWRAARRHSSQSLSRLAVRVDRPHHWEHLVLPEATLRLVREVAAAVAHRDRVYRRWRMAERTGRGSGLMVLFAGASGTGKTMTASVVANDLGLELYRIDLASVVSKYIGETEKNLDKIFLAARHSNAILFFDEADALLGKRSEVKDAHDRYANIEIAYLLQKMEEHEGVVILASNLPKNLDQAFARRMHYVVEFPRPDAALRERLWRGMFPPQAPVDAAIDFGFLAEQFETSGGEIQTVALDAAFLASADGGSILMDHVVRAMARHQVRQGNPAGPAGFKQYYALARRG